MSWWSEFADQIECNAPIGRQTWFRIGGRARYLFRPESANQLASMLQSAHQEKVPVRVLGSGANVLVSDEGFDGVVVRLDGPAFRTVEQDDECFEVGAGVDLMPLSRSLSEQGYSGLEFMAGIPATMGGAIRMNVGGPTQEIASVIETVAIMDLTGRTATWNNEQVGFGYRKSNLQGNIVVSARLRLHKDDPDRVKAKYDECFFYKQRSQPLADRSAGCIFKNPGDASAGALIDRAGLKGKRCGGASVSERHANFIVADATATASDVLELIDCVRERVQREFQTDLELEIEVLRPQGRGGGRS